MVKDAISQLITTELDLMKRIESSPEYVFDILSQQVSALERRLVTSVMKVVLYFIFSQYFIAK